ncbi:hypothetical protein Patl1_08261 [Pistacia atlantica]|uniref:Uncharacterized protein n=1 Tax=Pistacia atlantica TaxID=434234 RepID=A0ACC1AK08_9ROSI|nr:hypothetical protein Patl1_08261 [Pistacia atlantica]
MMSGCVANVNDDDEDHVSEVLDAQYIMFLENLKEDGKSYMLKHTLSNGTSAVVKYEEENDLDTGLGMGNLETMKDCHNIENIKTENFLGSQLEREKIESPRRILSSNLGKKMNESPRKVLRSNSVTRKTKSSKTVLRNSSRWRKTARATKTLKSGSIREDNESLSLKEAVKRENAETLGTWRSNPCGENGKSPSILNDAVKREKTERLGTLSNPRGENDKSSSIMNNAVKREKTESLETLKSNHQGENSKSPTILNDPVKREKTPCNRTLINAPRRESMGTERKLRDAHSVDKKSPVVEKSVQTETKSPVSCPETGCSIKRHSLDGIHLAKQRFNYGIKSEFDDESYQIHLNFVKKNDRCLVHAPEVGKKMVHFGDDESDSEVFVLDNPFFTGTPFVSARSRLYDVADAEGCTDNNESQFRDGLLEILQKPYDFTEYARLQIDSRPYLRKHDGSYHRRILDPPMLTNDLGCFNSSSARLYGRYLKIYFAEVIRQARRDRRKILNLFRGFFYWLQYMHSEGTFMPWLDSQIVSILPPDDY